MASIQCDNFFLVLLIILIGLIGRIIIWSRTKNCFTVYNLCYFFLSTLHINYVANFEIKFLLSEIVETACRKKTKAFAYRNYRHFTQQCRFMWFQLQLTIKMLNGIYFYCPCAPVSTSANALLTGYKQRFDNQSRPCNRGCSQYNSTSLYIEYCPTYPLYYDFYWITLVQERTLDYCCTKINLYLLFGLLSL